MRFRRSVASLDSFPVCQPGGLYVGAPKAKAFQDFCVAGVQHEEQVSKFAESMDPVRALFHVLPVLPATLHDLLSTEIVLTLFWIFQAIRGASACMIIATDCSNESFPVSMVSSGHCGVSNGAVIPVNSVMRPSRTFLYKPFGSRCSQI